MRKFLSQRKKKTILTSLALGFCLLMPCYRAEAVTSYTTPNGLFRLDYYGAGESFTGKWYLESLPEEEKVCLLSQGELPDWQKQQINCAADYWDGLLKHTAFPRQPVILAITVNQGEDNVDYGSMTEVETDGKTISVTTPNAILNHGKVLTEEDGPAGFFSISTSLFPTDGGQSRYDTPLSQNSAISVTPIVIHEIGHPMGYVSSAWFHKTHFSGKAELYDSYLYDWRGVQAKPRMEIKTPNHSVESEPYFDLPESYIDLGTGKSPYFSGRYVREVLEGAELNTYLYWGVPQEWKLPGLPIEGVTSRPDSGTDLIDLCHTELRNSLMSHQFWRNYVSFMEAELALFQDLGYIIDRRDYFGRSVYGDGLTVVNDSPFYARNADGTAYVSGAYNENPYGMGLHIYGSKNTVFQNAPLMTRGMAAVGIRIDGCGNSVTVNKGVNVQADGLNGNGILAAYGKDHRITLEEGSKVTAEGEGGIGAAFDFGQNACGNRDGARASYAARFWEDALGSAWVETDGPLVTDFTVQGELSGKIRAS